MASFRSDSRTDRIFNRLFILGGKELSEDDWKKHFSPFGTITKVHITKDHDTGRPKGQ